MRIKKMYQGTVPENKIVGTYTESDTDTYNCNYVNNKLEEKQDKGITLWTNQNPTSNFTSTQINLTSNNCSYFEIIYATRLSETNEVTSTGKLPFGKRTRLFYAFTSGAYLGVGQRVILTSSTSSLTFEDGYIQNANSRTASIDNSICIPLFVIGYK